MSGQPDGRIVVGYDGSPAARRAVDWAADAARRTDARLEVVLAWESMAPLLTPQPRIRLERDLEERAGRVLDEAVATLDDDLAVEPVLLQGPAAGTLVDRADGARLLVVGAHGRGGVMAGLGSMAARCVVWARVPTVVVPAEAAADASGPVVVGVDGSAGGARALRVALALAPDGTAVRMVHAWGIPGTAAFEVPPIEPALLEEGGRAVLDEAVASLGEADRERVETVLRPGDPRVVLGDEAPAASLLVIGSTGHSLFLHRLLGSTVTHLLHQHAVPVVVVPEEAEGWGSAGSGPA